jgi:hypothetical protein
MLDQNYKEYSDKVSEMLQAYFSHSLRNLPDNFKRVVVDWSNLFIKAGIPASQLMDIYLEAHIALGKGDYFNADSIIAIWNERRIQRLQEERQKEVCTVCKGKKHTMKYDFNLKKDISIDCPKCV